MGFFILLLHLALSFSPEHFFFPLFALLLRAKAKHIRSAYKQTIQKYRDKFSLPKYIFLPFFLLKRNCLLRTP